MVGGGGGGGGVGVDTDVRPDKTTHTGLPLTPRPSSIAAVPTIVAGAVLLLFTSSAAASEIGHGMGLWGKYVKP